jgi:hypothetical protein
MYVTPNFPSKAAARRAIAAGTKVELILYGPFDKLIDNGTVAVEGPHYPQPHKWWGTAHVKGGRVVKID